MFRKVDSKIGFPKLEEDILRFWKEHQIFSRSVVAREGAPYYVFYEGPPTANGSPGVHHVLSRLFKDIICRYKAMKGYYVPRKAGWDTHGLPVELEVERSLGFTSKTQIEAYGIAKFNGLCRQSALGYIGEWEAMTKRIGYWIDMEHPYITMDNDYIESCWWIIKQLWNKGLIYQGYKVAPHCPRCGTSLSSHEVSLGYRDDTEDPSIYIKFKIKPSSVATTALDPLFNNFMLKPAYLLAWTTTPWTLPGNTALAVAPNADYSVMEGENDYLIMASILVDKVGLKDYREVLRITGTDISGKQTEGLRYQPLFNPHEYGVERRRFGEYYVTIDVWRRTLEIQPEDKDLSFPVVGADFVSLDEGTGIVHIAPAFGDMDFEVGEDNDLDFVQPVDLIGKVIGRYRFAGKFVKDADPLILDDLKSRNLLYRSEKIIHTYPFCWRCDSPLLYYAKRSWYIKTTAVKDRLISGNAEINWYPEYIKHGRFGDWLENNVDWAFSRERYWGTPLNIWYCSSCDNYECVGSVDELRGKVNIRGLEIPLDLHRPYVDKVSFSCPRCGSEMRRVPEVIDCWFDSGAMPVAQWHYPLANEDKFRENFPADFVCEAIDQTRGWFYSLHAISTLLFDRPCVENVLCLGHVVDAQGEKMSKSKDNVVDPQSVINNYGADALRWYMLVSATPEENHRFSAEMVLETMRRFLLTLWNTYSFFTLYANIDRFVPQSLQQEELQPTNLLDSWVISRLNGLILDVTRALDNYDPTSAARRIEKFVEDLSNWYIRRSRRRFWKSENDSDKLAAYTTLYRCLVILSQLLAPLVPFIAEEIYQNLVCFVDPGAKESVHLTDYPVADEAQIDDNLNRDVALAMRISSLGRAARAKERIKVRQPLSKMVVKVDSKEEEKALNRLAHDILTEVNVKEVVVFRSTEIEPFQEVLGNMSSYSIAGDAKYQVALNIELTSELVGEGVSREIVRRLQNMRRTAGFDVADHIITYYQMGEQLRQIMVNFADYIKQETLSSECLDVPPPDEAYSEKHNISGSKILLAIKKLV